MLVCDQCGRVCEHQDIDWHVDQSFEAVLCDEHMAAANVDYAAAWAAPAGCVLAAGRDSYLITEAECAACGKCPEPAKESDMAEDRVWVKCGDEAFMVDVLVSDVSAGERDLLDIVVSKGKLAKYIKRVNELLKWQPKAMLAISCYQREIRRLTS